MSQDGGAKEAAQQGHHCGYSQRRNCCSKGRVLLKLPSQEVWGPTLSPGGQAPSLTSSLPVQDECEAIPPLLPELSPLREVRGGLTGSALEGGRHGDSLGQQATQGQRLYFSLVLVNCGP